MKPRLTAPLFLLCVLVLTATLAGAIHAKESAPVARHIILIIGDGMQPENEIAAGRYLTGRDDGLAFHAFPYRGFVATWDVTAYNRQAPRYGAAPYNPSAINPRVGCDAAPSGKADAPEKQSPLYLPHTGGPETPWRRFGLDGHGLGHGPQDRHRQHRLASRRPGSGRPHERLPSC